MPAVKHPLLLFDIDGTLMLSGGAGMRAMRRAGHVLFGDEFDWDGIETAGSLDPIIFAAAAAQNRIDDADRHHSAFRAHYLTFLVEELDAGRERIRVMPGVHDLLGSLRQRVGEHGDLTLGMLTGNYGAAVPPKLATIGVDHGWFSITAFGDEAPTRPDLVRLALDRFGEERGTAADPEQVVVIGDTPRDVACAHAHGCVAFAVATGYFSTEQLAEAGADVVVEDLQDPAPLMSLIDD
ncbi:MAG: hypothetical protein CMJ18_15830 [Phycisphaeraceae bacterium]|nr:hypothetical protein [Phycisphaeraceae bacterium]